MKIWHDDIRRPPDDTWRWARTNDGARWILSTEGQGGVAEISLDHDMGLDAEDPDDPRAGYRIGRAAETGMALVKWMCAEDLVPPIVTIHSLNVCGRDNMASYLLSWARFNFPDLVVRVLPWRESA